MRTSRSFWVGVAMACAPATALLADQVVVSEIMYHPRGGKPEYLELSNLTATPLDIAEWRFTDGVDYVFPSFAAAAPTLTFLKPFERIVVSSADEATTRAVYRIPVQVRLYGPWTGSLSDAGERITLKDKNGSLITTVEYNDRGHWPVAADGAGHSLVLKNPNRSIDDWRNWTASDRPDGTPGYAPAPVVETPVASPEVNLSQGIVLVDYGDTWRYDDKNRDLVTAWRATDYDDASWPQGRGLFGFETAALPAPGIQTPLADADQLTYYLRLRFNYSGATQGATLIIDQIVDDGAVYYLNGQELGRVGVAGGNVSFGTPANRTVSDATEELGVISLSNPPLVKGVNVLAVEVHQINTTSSDVVFGARVKVSVPLQTQQGVVINEVLPGAAGSGFVEFYNPGATTVNLRNHFLTDDPGNLRKFQLAGELIVPAGGFASAGFVESGLGLNNPVSVYLVAPDGASVLNAIRFNFPADGRSLGRKPAGSSAWFLFPEPTRNQANTTQTAVAVALRLNEVHFTSTGSVDWVEVHNSGDAALAMDQFFLSARRDFTDKFRLSGVVGPGGWASWDVAFPLEGKDVTLYLLSATDTVLDSRVFDRPDYGDTLQAFPDGSGEWYASLNSTRDAPNNPARNTDIVINEIMYDPPSEQTDGEFIELFNRGQTIVDVSGWRVTDAVEFVIPPGTRIAPGGFLVVAANAAHLRRVFPSIEVVGDWEGRLRNTGDLIRLLDQRGNLVDEVDYKPGGDWPVLAKTGGSSMELLHPAMDNDRSSAWRDSDESAKAPFRPYSYTSTFQQLKTMGAATDYKELHLHLVGDSHLALRNIQLLKNGTGTNLIVNGTKLSTNGASASGWLCQGTHWASYVSNGELHLVSDGRGDNRPNRAEIDVTGLERSAGYTLSFEGRWISGNPRLIAQTWDHSIATSIRLEVPEDLGTPGGPNSRLLPAPAPQVDDLRHSPAVPRPTDNVKITARVFSVEPLAKVEVFHRLDNDNANAVWNRKPMYDDGRTSGDAVAGDGIFTAELTEYRAQGRVAQFYVRAEASNGQASLLPRLAAARPALFIVDGQNVPRDLRSIRAVISAYDLGAISGGGGAKYSFKFPRLANHYFNATIIMDEADIYYGGEIRNSGSPWTRGGDLSRGKFKVPDDRAFRGHTKFTFDNDPGGGQMTHNRVTRQLLYLLGHPVNEHEFVRFYVNGSYLGVREDTEALDNEFLDRHFPDGSQGDLYRIDDEWWFTDSWSQEPQDAAWRYKGTENAGRYRTEWMKRTNEDEDDFSALINFFKTVAGAFTQADIERLIDPHLTLKMCAVRGYISDWDSFSLSRGKNGFFYRPPNGQFFFFHWDSDLAFGDANGPLYSGAPGFSGYINKPYNKRIFYSYLSELVQNYTKDSPRINAWFQAEEDASASYGANASFYRTWFNNRLRASTNAMGINYTRPLDITTNSGQPLTTTENALTLNGNAPYAVQRIFVEGHPEARFAWNTEIAWTLSGIRLRRGENLLTVKGVDLWGKVLKEDSILVTKTGNAPPAMVLEANPDNWRVRIEEAIELDGRESFDPDGGPLTFEWLVSPPDLVTLTPLVPGQVTATFARPGLYAFTLRAMDGDGDAAEVTREVAAYGATGFSSFGGTRLEEFWGLENVEYRDNYSPGAWLSLNDAPGEMTLQVLDEAARPVTAVNPTHPFVWRALPERTPWALQTQVRLDSRQFGNFFTGLLVESVEVGGTTRYAFGMDGGKNLHATKLASDGSSATLATKPHLEGQATVRVRRAGADLFFEQRVEEMWITLGATTVAADSVTPRGGLFLATTVPQAMKVGFDYALLVDESNTSALRENLRLTELMYNPLGGDGFEYVELMNIGATALDLTGASFTAGIAFTFGPTTLAAGQRLVVVKDRAAFVSRYGSGGGVLIAEGAFTGRLDNGGERLTLVDANGNLVFSFSYDDEGDWPTRADGFGAALEVINPRAGYDDPDNWRASTEFLGSPGATGAGPLPGVVINEVLAHSDPPLEDAIELFNPTPQPVDVSGWFLSDSLDDLKKFRLPSGTVLPPQGYAVFYEVAFKTNNTLVPFSLSSARGDDVWLMAADAAGNLTRFVDHVEFGPSENGVSFGRFPNGVGPLTAMSQLTFGTDVKPSDPPGRLGEFEQGRGAPNAYPKVGPIVLNRIMYHPPFGGDEFIEVLNASSQTVPLYDPQAPTNTWRLAEAVEFSFPAGATLGPGERALIVALTPAAFRLKYGLPDTRQIFGPYVGSLDNAGEDLELQKPDAPQTLPPNVGLVPYVVVEKVRYDNRPSWPVLADGYGAALERIDPAKFGHDPANWRAGDAVEKDGDGDGIPDAWELAYGLDPRSNADAALDADGDGVSNLHEFISGTDPRNASSYLRVEAAAHTGEAFTLSFTAIAGRSYSVLSRDNVAGGTWQVLQRIAAPAATKAVQVQDPSAGTVPARFYRLVIDPR